MSAKWLQIICHVSVGQNWILHYCNGYVNNFPLLHIASCKPASLFVSTYFLLIWDFFQDFYLFLSLLSVSRVFFVKKNLHSNAVYIDHQCMMYSLLAAADPESHNSKCGKCSFDCVMAFRFEVHIITVQLCNKCLLQWNEWKEWNKRKVEANSLHFQNKTFLTIWSWIPCVNFS